MPKAKKSLGQNFLIDPAVTNQILQFINPDSKDIFLEIGPGKVLINLIKRSYKDAKVCAINNISDIQNIEIND